MAEVGHRGRATATRGEGPRAIVRLQAPLRSAIGGLRATFRRAIGRLQVRSRRATGCRYSKSRLAIDCGQGTFRQRHPARAGRRREGPRAVPLHLELLDFGGRRPGTPSPSAKATENRLEQPDNRTDQERPEGDEGVALEGSGEEPPAGGLRRGVDFRTAPRRCGTTLGFIMHWVCPTPCPPLQEFGDPGLRPSAPVSADSLVDAPRISGSPDRPLMSLLTL